MTLIWINGYRKREGEIQTHSEIFKWLTLQYVDAKSKKKKVNIFFRIVERNDL